MWPDLAKFRCFGKILKVFDNSLSAYLVFGIFLNRLWQNLCASWANFHKYKRPKIEKRKAILTHWSASPYLQITTIYTNWHLMLICSVQFGSSPSVSKLSRNQCDQIGRFLKVFGDKLSFKSRTNVCWLLGYFENITFDIKTAVVSFLGNLENIGLLF